MELGRPPGRRAGSPLSPVGGPDMDRRQIVVQRAREFFGDRLDDVVHMVRQDRQEMRGWQEPAHLRAVLRRTIREQGGSGNPTEATQVMLDELEFCRSAGEPDRGQQREAIGQLLEAGAVGLEKIARNASDFTPEELFGLEAVLLLYGRPALLIAENRLASVPPFWNLISDQNEEIEIVARGVGRIELLGHPEFDWAGTGFLVNETTLLTTRRTVEVFAEQRNGQWAFRPGITAWMNYQSPHQRVAAAGYRVRGVRGVHERYDLALLEVEPPHNDGRAPAPLALAAEPPPCTEGREVYLVGYPVRDARRNDPERMTRIFRDVYNVKRVQPGVMRGCLHFHELELLQHDCAPLGRTGGG